MINALATARKAAGISQRALSTALGRPHNYVYLVEKGNRMINWCEGVEYALWVEADPVEVTAAIMKALGPQRRRRKPVEPTAKLLKASGQQRTRRKVRSSA